MYILFGLLSVLSIDPCCKVSEHTTNSAYFFGINAKLPKQSIVTLDNECSMN